MSKHKFLSLSVFLFLSLTFFSPFVLRAQDDIDQYTPPSDKGPEYVGDFIKAQKQIVENIFAHMSFYAYHIDEKIRSYKEAAAQIELRMHQTYFMLLININNPYEFRTAHREVMRSAAAALDEIKKIERARDVMAGYVSLIEKILGELKFLSSSSLAASRGQDMSYVIEMAENIKYELMKFYLDLDAAAVNSYRMEDEALKIIGSNREMLQQQILKFIFKPVGSLFNIDSLMFIYPSFVDWTASLGYVCSQKLPDQASEWGMLLVIILVIGGSIQLAGRIGLRKLPALIGDSSPQSLQYLKRALLFVSLGVPLFFSELTLQYPETLTMYWLGVIYIMAAIINFSWGLKVIKLPTEAKSPLRPLFFVYIVGIICQTLNMNLEVFMVIWPVAALLSVVMMVFKLRQNFDSADKAFLWISIALSLIFILMCANGYVYMAILLQLLWFTLAVGIRAGSSVRMFVVMIVKKHSRHIPLFWRLIMTETMVPLIWIAIVIGIIFFAFDQVGEMTLAIDALNTNIKLGDLDFKTVNVAAIVFLFFIFRLILHLINSSLDRIAEISNIRNNMLPSVQTLTFYAVWTLYAILSLKLVGINFTTLLVVLGGLSVGIGFGLQNIVNNFISGLIILFSRSLHQGDIIQVGTNLGVVEKINMRSTVLLTYENAIIVVPNTTLLTSDVTNWTRNDMSVRRDIPLSVNYDAEYKNICEIIAGAVLKVPHVMSQPEKTTEVLLSELGESAMKLTVRLWIDDIRFSPEALSDARRNISLAFKEKGVTLK